MIGVHGSADIASTLVQEGSGSSTVFVKRGFNLGIPINTYLSLATPARETTAQPAPTFMKAADYFLAAEEHFQRKNFPAAIENYMQAIALNPQYTEAYGISSFLNLLLGNFGTAVADGDRALALSPNNSDLQMIQSLALFLSGDFRRSIPVFDRLIAANPKSTDYHLLRGIAAFLMGDYTLSRPSWTALTQLTPKDPFPSLCGAGCDVSP